MQANIPTESRRSAAFKALFLACLERRRPLGPDEAARLLNRFTEEEPL